MKYILISRTDSIGDVVLTLPMCGWLKQHMPQTGIVFLGKNYTKAVIESCPDVDVFLNWDEMQAASQAQQLALLKQYQIEAAIHVFPNRDIARLCKQAGIPLRIGTRNRWFHWLSCNRLLTLSRRHSVLHESQLNLELLRPLGLQQLPERNTLAAYLHLAAPTPLPAEIQAWLQPGKPHVLLHPKSQGSGREWDLEKFGLLARELHQRGYQVFVSGTASEQASMKDWLIKNKAYITDITAKLTLPQFLSFISVCDGLVAAGTGPLHLAAALGIHALGLFPPIKPIHPGRWAPVGPKAEYLVLEKDCQDCRRNPTACQCIRQISVAAVLHRIEAWNLPVSKKDKNQ